MNAGTPLRVVVAGGGIAGLEALLALRELAGDRVDLTLLEPRAHLTLRALEPAEPFGSGRAGRLPVAEVARRTGATVVREGVERVDAHARQAATTDGGRLGYDALLIAVGARPVAMVRGAVTWMPGGEHRAFARVLADVEEGSASRLAFVVPARCPWALPAYELALMTARRFASRDRRPEIVLVTPEQAPLAIFGPAGSAAVAQALEAAGVAFVGNGIAAVRGGTVDVWPGSRRLAVDRVVTLPHAVGPDLPGLRADIEGFLVTDGRCAARGARQVWAVGDATSRRPMTGGLAARQADCAAQEVARLAGARLPAATYVPLLRAQLRTGAGSVWLQRDISDPADAGRASPVPLWSPPGKIAARRLGTVLAEHDVPGGLRVGSAA